MAHPRAARNRSFPQSTRAIVTEAEWKVMAERIAQELKPLVKLARDQGWTIGGNDNGKLVWRGPNGEGPVYTSYRVTGRDLMNFRSNLVKAGLRLDEETAKEHVHDEAALEIIEQAQDVSIDDVHKAMNFVSGSVAVLIAKAEASDELSRQAKEWQELAEEAQATAEQFAEKYKYAETMLDAIRHAFSMAPWAILPEIAQLLGIDANMPSASFVQPAARRPE